MYARQDRLRHFLEVAKDRSWRVTSRPGVLTLRRMIDEEEGSPSRRTNGDHADGGFQLYPEHVPSLILSAVYPQGYTTNQANDDHEEAETEDEGDS